MTFSKFIKEWCRGRNFILHDYDNILRRHNYCRTEVCNMYRFEVCCRNGVVFFNVNFDIVVGLVQGSHLSLITLEKLNRIHGSNE